MPNLALGTAQFGLNYGIANKEGQILEEEAEQILNYAREQNINTLDTAIGYGDSEKCLGNVGVEDWQVITKLPEIPDNCEDVFSWVKDQVDASLVRLGIKSLSGILLHRPMQLLENKGEKIWEALNVLKNKKITNKIGFSIYEPIELDKLWTIFQPDIVQAPYNLLDQRLETSGWLGKMYNNDVEVHVRSVFLQGLLLMGSSERSHKFYRWTSVWKVWSDWLSINGVSALQACLSFVMKNKNISRVVVGVDNLQQLNEIISASKISITHFPQLIANDTTELINPSFWDSL